MYQLRRSIEGKMDLLEVTGKYGHFHQPYLKQGHMVLCLELSSSRHQCEIEWVRSRQVFEVQLLERPSSRNLGERLDVTTLWCNVLKYRLLVPLSDFIPCLCI